MWYARKTFVCTQVRLVVPEQLWHFLYDHRLRTICETPDREKTAKVQLLSYDWRWSCKVLVKVASEFQSSVIFFIWMFDFWLQGPTPHPILVYRTSLLKSKIVMCFGKCFPLSFPLIGTWSWYLSRSTTKPAIWPVRPAKTKISLGICPVWSVFAERSLGS